MATVHPISGPSSPGPSGPRGPTYQVATRELSADFASVGPEHNARELGAIDGGQFLKLLEQLVAIDAIKLIDADPQIIVTVKSGRFLIQPQSGKLLVRPVNALDQVFFRFAPAEIPPFLDGAPPPGPKAFTTLIGSATIRAESTPPVPMPAANSPPAPEKKSGRSLILAGLVVLALAVAGGSAWFFLQTSAPPPPLPKAASARVPELDAIIAPGQLASLQQRFAGTYVTSGEAGERLLELKPDGTFKYQEFGSSLAVTKHDNGTYSFALRHGTPTPVVRAPVLGPVEIRDENSLFLRGALFTRLPAPAK